MYPLYMYSNIQYVNKNTSMPIKRTPHPHCRYSARMKKNISHGREDSDFSSISSVWSECRNVYTDYCSGSFLNELELTIRMCILTLAPTCLVPSIFLPPQYEQASCLQLQAFSFETGQSKVLHGGRMCTKCCEWWNVCCVLT